MSQFYYSLKTVVADDGLQYNELELEEQEYAMAQSAIMQKYNNNLPSYGSVAAYNQFYTFASANGSPVIIGKK